MTHPPQSRSLARRRPVLSTALALGFVPLVLAAPHVLAQDPDDDGRTLTFGLTQGITLNDNLALDATSAGTTVQANTGLSFALATETATDRLDLSGAGGLRIVDGPGYDGTEVRMSDPRLAFSYTRLGARAELGLSLAYERADIAFLRPLSDFAGPGGEITLPDDLDDLTGSGTREALSFGASLELRKDAPFGITLSAGQDRLAYRDVTDPDLLDNTRTSLGLGLRFDLNEVTTATLDLSASRFEEAGAGSRDTQGLAGAIAFARPNGTLSFRLTLDDTPDGQRASFSVARDFALPTGALDLSLGLTRGVDDEISATGSLRYAQDYAGGQVTAALRQSVTAGNDDTEQRLSAVTLGLSHDLGNLGTLGLDAAWARTVETADGSSTEQADFGVALSRNLSRDWSLDVGLRHTIREDADDTSLSLTIGRNFTLPF